MPVIEMPDGVELEFPDSMSKDEMRQAVLSKYPAAQTSETDKAATSLADTRKLIRDTTEIQQEEAKKEGDRATSLYGLANAGETAADILSRTRPDLLVKQARDLAQMGTRKLLDLIPGMPATPPNAVTPPVLPPEAVGAAREGVANLLQSQVSKYPENPIDVATGKTIDEMISSMAEPENVLGLGAATKYPELARPLFSAPMVADIPEAGRRLLESQNAPEAAANALQLGATVGFPALIEHGLKTPPRMPPEVAAEAANYKPRALPFPQDAAVSEEIAKLEADPHVTGKTIIGVNPDGGLKFQDEIIDKGKVQRLAELKDGTAEVAPAEAPEVTPNEKATTEKKGALATEVPESTGQVRAPEQKGEIAGEVTPSTEKTVEATPQPSTEPVTAPATVEEILKPKADPIEETLSRWIDDLGKHTGLLSDPLFIQSIGKPLARLVLMAAREAYRAGKSTVKAVEAGLSRLRDAMPDFNEADAREWLRSVIPNVTEAKQVAAEQKAGLREVLSRSEAAGEAGRKAGIESTKPLLSDLRDKLSDSISKAQALGEHLRGQQKGSQIGAASAKADAEHIDRWLEADSGAIRDGLINLVNQLPVAERGRFVSAITAAMKRPGLFAGDVKVGGKVNPQKITAVENMYRKAADVAARIENRISEVEIRDLEDEIGKFSKWKDSKTIDVPYRQRIRAELDNFNRLKKAGGLSKDALEAFKDRLTSLRDIGRSEQTTKTALWEWQKEFAERALKDQETNPVESRPELRPLPGDKTPISMRIRNWLRNAFNKADFFDKAISPIDALFDLMDDAKGTYRGWLFRFARGPVDLGFNEATVKRNALLERFERFVKQTGLTPENAERIGVYAQNLQEGGRERLIEAGLTPTTIDRIVGSMTRNELAAYRLMRRTMDSQLPGITNLMRNLYNSEVKPEPNYFPMPRDWRMFEDKPEAAPKPGMEPGYDELATWKSLLEDLTPRNTHSARKGFTTERQAGAKTPIRIDAFDIFRQHINDVAYLQEMQPTLKRLGEIGRGDLFREKYGDVGRKIFLDWLDTVARQGGVQSFKRWKLLDTLRRNTSIGIIGFRVASQLVHESNIPYIYARIGTWFHDGLLESATERGQAFIKRNLAETQERGGSEPAQVESEREGVKIGGVQMISPKVAKASYAIARGLDKINSQGAALGAYLKILKDKGLDWRNYDSIPVDRQAQAEALTLTRRAIASPLPKDVPQALTRGALTGGNVSVGRSLFQFQNIFLDQWSNIRHDLYQAGIRSKNPKLAAKMFLAVTGAIALETAIKTGVKEGIQGITGYQPKKDENALQKKVITETLRRFPLGGQIETELMYGESGIPALDATLELPKQVRRLATAQKPETQARALIKTVGAGAQLMGVPGASQAADILSQTQ